MVACCSHAGKMKVGTQAPPSITINSTASVVTPRAVAGELPIAATSRPKVAAIIAHAIETARKPATLPSMRTWKTIMANPNETSRISSDRTVPLAALLERSVTREMGALRRRFHSPRWRSSSISTPMFAMANSRN